jgi:tetratricopeptide (TPR) repeat protein
VRDAILGQAMLPLMMETDSAIPDRGLLTNSLKMVDDADIYVLLISNYRYGQIIANPGLNPGNVSVTELEFERAVARGLKICAYLMHESVQPPSVDAVFAEAATRPQLDAFRTHAQHPDRITARFVSPHDLRAKVTQTLADLRETPGAGSGAPADGNSISVPDRCFGRSADTDRIAAILTAGSTPVAVLVQGPGGIGKTTLTQDVGNHPSVVARFGQRRWFAELETATDRDTFDTQLLLALGLEPTRGFATAIRYLGQAPALLVLDNLETPWGGAGPAVEARLATLAAVPGIALRASFRGQQAVGGARWTLRHPVEPLPEPEARALFLDIAQTIRGDDAELPALLEELGGVPLAICLTARRALGADLAGLWAEWRRIGIYAATWKGSMPGRLTSVPHSIALSLQSNRLGQDGHRLFALLGQCPAGLAPADQTALLGHAAFAAEEGLLAVGLAHHRGPRLDLLPPVRDYARRHCPPDETDTAVWCRHFLDRVRTEGGRIMKDGGAKALAELTPEVANIDAAVRAAPRLSLRAVAVAALGGVYRLLSCSGAGTPASLDVLARACAQVTDVAGQAECHFYQAKLGYDRSDYVGAPAEYERAMSLYRQVEDLLGEANCVMSLGEIAFWRSDYVGARAEYERAMSLYRQVEDLLGEANCIKSLGDIEFASSDYSDAQAHFDQALSLYRQVEDLLGEANCVKSLGDIEFNSSDYTGVRVRYEQAMLLYRRIGSVMGEANCMLGLGRVALAENDLPEARSIPRRRVPCIRASMQRRTLPWRMRILRGPPQAPSGRATCTRRGTLGWRLICPQRPGGSPRNSTEPRI